MTFQNFSAIVLKHFKACEIEYAEFSKHELFVRIEWRGSE